jgi:hypothetical protein
VRALVKLLAVFHGEVKMFPITENAEAFKRFSLDVDALTTSNT